MQTGKLRHLIIFQRPVESQNDTGEVTINYQDEYTRYARVSPLRGQEIINAIELESDIDYKIETRYDSALEEITPKWRIKFKNIFIDITSVINVEERNIKLEILGRNLVNG